MRSDRLDTRRGAALVMAIVVILGMVIMIIGFLQTSIRFSEASSVDTVRAEAMAAADLGLGLAYHRVRNDYSLEDELIPDPSRTDGGREWNSGWVRGTVDKQNGNPTSNYEVQIWWSDLPKIAGTADSGTNTQFTDVDLTTTTRPENWFPGKIVTFITGDLAGYEVEIDSLDKTTGTLVFADPQKWAVQPADEYEIPAGVEYEYEASGTHDEQRPGGITREIETWWWKQKRPLKKYSQRGAVVANSRVQVLGQIEIDGRDHCANGGREFTWFDPASCPVGSKHHILGAGVKGVSTTGNVEQGGASGIGGDGAPPAKQPLGLTYAEEAYPSPIDDLVDNDGDGATDEDPYNGADDDRDASGEIVPDFDRDEDMRYPTTPDEALAVDAGTLKAAAESTGTYFTSQKAFQDYVKSVGGVLPGGQVYYLEVDSLSTGKIEMDMSGTDDPANDPIEIRPIVFVVHKLDGSGNPVAEVNGLHIIMKGLFMCDVMDKVNAGTRIIGGVQTFSDNINSNIFGNGQAKIWYSSDALANLPSNVKAATYHSTTWREEP